jgi:hypothetical protein
MQIFPAMSVFYSVCQFLYKYNIWEQFYKVTILYSIVTTGNKICPMTFAVGLRHQTPTAE